MDLFKIESESIVINKDMYKILKEEIIHEVIEQVEKRVSKLSEEILQPLSKNEKAKDTLNNIIDPVTEEKSDKSG